MKIAVTGTPGVGKTRFSKQLAKYLGLTYVNLGELAKEKDCITGNDKARDTLEVDIEKLRPFVEKLDDVVLDSHFSHEFKADEVIVLRLRPPILKNRLEKRGWKKKKIQENVEAEAMGLIFDEVSHLALQIIGVGDTLKAYIDKKFVNPDYSHFLFEPEFLQ